VINKFTSTINEFEEGRSHKDDKKKNQPIWSPARLLPRMSSFSVSCVPKKIEKFKKTVTKHGLYQ
jgi:hypothetical protein